MFWLVKTIENFTIHAYVQKMRSYVFSIIVLKNRFNYKVILDTPYINAHTQINSITDRITVTMTLYCITVAQPRGAAGGTPPPLLDSQENSWLRRWAKYTKLCMVWQPNILNICYELSGGYAPPNNPPGALPLDPAGGPPFSRPTVPHLQILATPLTVSISKT